MKSKSISRFISLFLVLALCFTMFPCTVFAADTISTEPMRLPTLEDVLAGNVTPEEFEFFINTTPPSTAYDISAVLCGSSPQQIKPYQTLSIKNT